MKLSIVARWRRSAAVVLLVASATGVRAAEPAEPAAAPAAARRFQIDIDAPRPWRRLLEDGLDLVRWQADERMTPELLRRLVAEAERAASDALAAEGYFSARVSSAIDEAGETTAVRLHVDPGSRTHVAAVDLRYAGALAGDDADARKRREQLERHWPLAVGAPFRQADWDQAKREALATLAGGRYAAAHIVESAARIDPETQSARLEVTIDSGPVFRAGPVKTTGLKRYPASIVENLNPLTPGAPYDEDSLILYQRRLLQTGYFSTVHLAVDPDPAHAAAAPLLVSVIEARSQRIDTGLSFSTDTRLRLQVDYANSDVDDRAYRLRAQLVADTQRQSVETSLDTPPETGGVWYSLTTRLRAQDIQGERTREAVVGVSRNWGVWSTPSQLSLTSHFEEKDIAGAAGESVHAVFAGYRYTFRETDALVQPRRGVLGNVQFGGSVPGLSSRDFVRALGRATVLWPLGPNGDLALRGDAGAVIAGSRTGIPTSFLFRAGGDQSVRGYAFESLGVRQGEAIVGGRYLLVGSVEYTRWVAPAWGAAVFMDAGDAFDEPGEFRAARGYGVGARWRSPIGPFRADLAYGERDKRLRLHFSVGFSF